MFLLFREHPQFINQQEVHLKASSLKMLQHRKTSMVTLFPLSINISSHLSTVVLKILPFLEDEVHWALGKLVIQKMIHKEAHLF